jgi:acylphosphatase
MDIRHLKIQVYGLVQGVFFRDTTRRVAKKLNLTGYVKNMRDGSVLIEAEGPIEKLSELIEFARVGPKWARVDKIDYGFSDILEHYSKFKFSF